MRCKRNYRYGLFGGIAAHTRVHVDRSFLRHRRSVPTSEQDGVEANRRSIALHLAPRHHDFCATGNLLSVRFKVLWDIQRNLFSAPPRTAALLQWLGFLGNIVPHRKLDTVDRDGTVVLGITGLNPKDESCDAVALQGRRNYDSILLHCADQVKYLQFLAE